MKLFHTSPDQIETINGFGRFGGGLFFSSDIYVMSSCDYVSYSIDINDSEIIDSSSLFYRDDASKLSGLVAEVIEMIGCDSDTAEDLLSQRKVDIDIDDDMDWDIQAMTGQAAKILGFSAVSMEDEQGFAVLIDMEGREKELMKV